MLSAFAISSASLDEQSLINAQHNFQQSASILRNTYATYERCVQLRQTRKQQQALRRKHQRREWAEQSLHRGLLKNIESISSIQMLLESIH